MATSSQKVVVWLRGLIFVVGTLTLWLVTVIGRVSMERR